MNWISVKDRLPGRGTDVWWPKAKISVIVYIKDKAGKIAKGNYDHIRKEWFENGWLTNLIVTHWMSLSDPSEKKQ